jgi:N-(2-amino-2-carboxyethyl)-L-glutamate synthase
MIEKIEQENKIHKHTKLIESSSGNLGVALSLIAKVKNYSFTCVVDVNSLPEKLRLIEAYGAKLVIIDEKDENGGYLSNRIRYIKNKIAEDSDYIWLKQYANENNWKAHYHSTAEEILEEFDKIDYLFVGAGTTGTLIGCVKKFQEKSPDTKVIAVDSAGSITFGAKSKPRFIPGLGTSRCPEITKKSNVIEDLHELLMVEESDGVYMCNEILNEYGLLLGGSSGSVLHAVYSKIAEIPEDATVVAISPDFGENYLDSIYDKSWVEAHFSVLQSVT